MADWSWARAPRARAKAETPGCSGPRLVAAANHIQGHNERREVFGLHHPFVYSESGLVFPTYRLLLCRSINLLVFRIMPDRFVSFCSQNRRHRSKCRNKCIIGVKRRRRWILTRRSSSSPPNLCQIVSNTYFRYTLNSLRTIWNRQTTRTDLFVL